MPFIVRPSRRDVLRLAGAAVTAAAARGFAADRASRWALLADTHIPANREEENRGFRPCDNLEKVVAQFDKAGPEGCIIGGDLARLRGLAGDYDQLKNLLLPVSERMPVGYCMGNHDDRDNFAAAFSSTTGEAPPLKQRRVAVIDKAPVRMILLDSLIEPNKTPGFLGKEQRTWLDAYLGKNTEPTVLFVHHTLDDGDNSLLDSDRFLRIAAKHQHVKAVFYGHSHRYSYDTYEGVHLVNVPAVGYNFRDDQPVGWLEAKCAREGVDLTLHAVGGNMAEDGKSRSLRWRS